MSEEEVMKKTLPDLLDYNLDYVIVSLLWNISQEARCEQITLIICLLSL